MCRQNSSTCTSLAQLVERGTLNSQVVRSSRTWPTIGRFNSAGECFPYKEKVVGSNPSTCIQQQLNEGH